MFGSVTDIVTGHSPTRGRIILGLRSNTEYLEFKEAVLAPTYNFMLFDSIMGQVLPTIESLIHKHLPAHTQILKDLLDNLRNVDYDINKIDPILLQRLVNFIEKNIYITNFVLMLNACREKMVEAVNTIKITDEKDIKTTNIFSSVFSILALYNSALTLLEGKQNPIIEMYQAFTEEYIKLFDKLQKEIMFKLSMYFKQKKSAMEHQ